MNVYFKEEGKLAVMQVDTEDHAEAILAVQESLVEKGTGFDDPVLALITGGKKNDDRTS